METIIFAGVIIAIAGGIIYYYNRNSQTLDVNQDGVVDHKDLKQAVKNTAQGLVKDSRDARDLALSLTSESAAKALNAVDKDTKPRRTTKKPTTKTTAKPAAKATKPRTRRSAQ